MSLDEIPAVFRQIRQVGYIVRDLDAALSWWTSVMGAGPFYLARPLRLGNYVYAGASYPAPEVGFALGHLGDMQIELLQQYDDTPSMYLDFLREGCEGLHHIAVWALDFDEEIDRLRRDGLEVQQSAESVTGGPGTRYAYLIDRRHPGTVIEVSEVSGSKGELFRWIADSSKDWDGNDPVRELPTAAPAGGPA